MIASYIYHTSKNRFTLTCLLLFLLWPATGLLAQVHLPLERELDIETIRGDLQYLGSLPETFTHTIQLPLDNGKMQRFSVGHSPILAPELAAQYPEINTYILKGLDDPSITGRMSMTPWGMEAFLLRNGESILIQPKKENSRIYTVGTGRGEELPFGLCGQQEEPLTQEVIDAYKNRGSNQVFNTLGEINYGNVKRTYKLAVIGTGEFYDKNKGTALDAATREKNAMWVLTNGVNAVSAIFERELAVSFIITKSHIFTNLNSDPFIPNLSNITPKPKPLADQAEEAIKAQFPDDKSYDIGHIWHTTEVGDNWQNGGVGATPGACNSSKARGWSGGRENTSGIFYRLAAHEFGHMFGAHHTFNGDGGGGNACTNFISDIAAYEIGSGSTIMSYQGNCEASDNIPGTPGINYFHHFSLFQMLSHIEGNGNCYEPVTTSNVPPVINANPGGAPIIIPKGTPFTLTGSGTDSNGDGIIYTWEQLDEGGPGSGSQGDIGFQAARNTNGPIFRSFPPTSNPSRTIPLLKHILAGKNNPSPSEKSDLNFEALPMVARTINMTLTGRDNVLGVNSSTVKITVDPNAGPFEITSQNGTTTFEGGTSQTITWNVAGTNANQVNCTNVKISLSVDGGQSFPYALTNSTPNSGTARVTIPNVNTKTARIKVEAVEGIFLDINNADITINSDCLAQGSSIIPSAPLRLPAGDPGLDLGLNHVVGVSGASKTLSVTSSSPKAPAAGKINKTTQSCLNTKWPMGYVMLDFSVSESGDYTLSKNVGFLVMAVFQTTSDKFDPNTPCASPFLASNYVPLPKSGGYTEGNPLSLSLVAGQSYVAVGYRTTDGDVEFNFSGTGDVIFTEDKNDDYAYTYLALNTASNTIVAVDENSDFSSLSAGNYKIYGLSYKKMGTSPPNDIVPGNFVGQSLGSLLNGNNCVLLSGNYKELTVESDKCGISAISLSNVGACDDKGTSDPSDDTFTADVTVTFSNAPSTGSLDLTGAVTTSIPVGSLTGTNSHIFTGLNLKNNGTVISLNAAFSDDAQCSFTSNDPTPVACPVPVCSISGISVTNISACNDNGTPNPNDDTFTANITVNFTGAPSTGTLDIRGDGSSSIAVGSLGSATSHTFTGVSMPADGGEIALTASFSADASCTLSNSNAGRAPASCSSPSSCTATFTALDDIKVDAGIQQNLGGGSPSGGTYSGPGVTDNGNGTYNFDPAIAGVGVHTLTYTSPSGWGNIGQDILGEEDGDWSGYSVSFSSDGNRLAIGGLLNDGGGFEAGHVRVYEWNGTSWMQLGQDIDGNVGVDRTGAKVSLSADGNRLAIGAANLYLLGSPFLDQVRIYEWNGSAWVQMGTDINDAPGNFSMLDVSLSADGNRVAIGADFDFTNNRNGGTVRVYEWNGSNWIQKGNEISGEATEDVFGVSVSFSANGSRLAIGAFLNDGNGENAGHVRVYEWNGTAWIQLGSDMDGAKAQDRLGESVSLSANGNRLVVGAPLNPTQASGAGYAQVYEWNGTAWGQLGSDVKGETTGDRFGENVAISPDGSRLAIGATFNDENGKDAGHVRIFEWNGSAWSQVGLDIDGDIAGDRLGQSVSFSSDGSRLAMGAFLNKAGYVRVLGYGTGCRVTDDVEVLPISSFASFSAPTSLFIDAGIQPNLSGGTPPGGTYSGPGVTDNGDGTYDFDPAAAGIGVHNIIYNAPTGWVQLGQDIDAEAEGDNSGRAVAISSNGNRVAIGAFANDGNGDNAGHVRVLEWDGATWSQLGADIDGEAAGDNFGDAVSFSSDGNRIAIGAVGNDGNGDLSGHVRVLEWDGSVWTQLGSDIDGAASGDLSGNAVSLSSDGNRLAIGASESDGNGNGSGHVRVFQWNGSTWTQLGADIDGESEGDRSGVSVSIAADGNRVAVGASLNNGNGDNAGHVRVYEWNGSIWKQLGADIDGKTPGDRAGDAVSLSSDGTRLAIGAFGDLTNDLGRGRARVYEWNGTTWTQMGVDILGAETEDLFGLSISISSDGRRLAVGAPGNFIQTSVQKTGYTRVLEWDGSAWTQLGADINGEAIGDNFGWAVALSNDGSRLVAGARWNIGKGNFSGHVRVYALSPASTVSDQVEVLPVPCLAIFTATSDLPINTGVQTNLSGGSPEGGKYSGPGVTDNGNGTYNFDPAAAGVGTHTLTYNAPAGWVQVGQDLDGEATVDWFGSSVSFSENGERLAIGGQLNDGSGEDAGHVRVFDWTGSAWSQLGIDIDGEAAGDRSGAKASLSSDGNRLAIAAQLNSGNGENAGHVRIFEWNGSNWVQLGSDIDGDPKNSSGVSVVISSDGNRVAIGSISIIKSNGGFGPGLVRVYSWSGTSWTQLGDDLLGKSDLDRFGSSVSFSQSGNRLAIGALGDIADRKGLVRIYEWSGTAWAQLGTDVNGDAIGDGFGVSTSFSSDGNRLAVGASGHDGGGVDAGLVRVFSWNGTSWEKLGGDIQGEAAGDLFGVRVSLSSDGNRFAAGATLNDGNGENSGHARAFEWNGTTWGQLGLDIDGEEAGDISGISVALSPNGRRMAIGSQENDGSAPRSGHVRVFELSSACSVTDDVEVLQSRVARNTQFGELLDPSLHVFPNPTDRSLTVNLPVKERGTYRLRIVDTNGRTVFERENTLEAGPNSLEVKVSHLPEGVYMIVASGNGYREMLRFTKN